MPKIARGRRTGASSSTPASGSSGPPAGVRSPEASRSSTVVPGSKRATVSPRTSPAVGSGAPGARNVASFMRPGTSRSGPGGLSGTAGAAAAAAFGRGGATPVGGAGEGLGLLTMLGPLRALSVRHLSNHEIAAGDLLVNAVELGLTLLLISLTLGLRHISRVPRRNRD